MKMAKRILSILMAVMMVLSCWVWVEPSAVASNTANAAEAAKDKYLFAYFTGNSSDGQTVHLAVSEDGLHYDALRYNEPVIIPAKGTGAVRDPYIWYDEQEGYYYLVCTDMDADIASDPNNIGYWWDNSDAFLMWRSKDLIHWFDETYINVKDLLNQNFNANVGDVYRAWAPQIMHDGESYVFYFSLITDNATYNSDNLAIVYLRTSDLMDLSKYTSFGTILDPGANIDVNDAEIIQNPTNGKWHLFYKTETPRGENYAKVKMLVSDSATGPYSSTDVGLDVFSTVGEALEGGNGFFDNNGNFVLYADAYMHNGGTGNPYFYVATTPASGDFTSWTIYGENAHNINSLSPRHGSVVKISEAEYNNLLDNTYSISSSTFPESEKLTDHLVARYFTTDNVKYNAATGNEDLTVNGSLTTTKLNKNGIGYYAGFDGSQYATVDLNGLLPDSFNYDDGFTITFKAKPSGNNDSRFFQILNGTSSTEIACWGGSSGLYATYSNATQVLAITNSCFNDGSYHDYQISYANGNLILYVDGNLVIKKNRFNSPAPLQQTPLMNDTWYDALGNGTLSIGALVGGGTKIVADISDFCVYDCAMSYYDVQKAQLELDIASGLATKASIVVPETVYMTPSASTSTTAQYYVNNILLKDTLTVEPEADNDNEIPYIQFYIPGAKDVTIAVNAINSEIGDIVLTAQGEITNYENVSLSSFLDEDGYFNCKIGDLYINGTGLSAGQTAVAEWVFTITMEDGRTRTFYAYSTLYAPYISSIGAIAYNAGRKGKAYGEVFGSSFAWITGAHSALIADSTNTGNSNIYYRLNGSSYETATSSPYYQGLRYPLLSGNYIMDTLVSDLTIGNGETNPESWFTTTNTGASNTFRLIKVQEGADKNDVQEVSPIAKLTVDTSRYTNFSQIPNLKIGYQVTDVEKADESYWYFADYSNVISEAYSKDQIKSDRQSSEKNIYNDSIVTGNSVTVFASSGAPGEWKSHWGGSDDYKKFLYNGIWNRDIKGIDNNSKSYYLLKGSLHTYNNATYDGRAYTHLFVQVEATHTNKSSIRDVVLEGASFAKEDYTNTTWSAFQTALRDAATTLGNPTVTTDDGKINTLITKRDNLHTRVTLDANGGTANPTYKDVIVGSSRICTVELSDCTATRTGYTFEGWSVIKDTVPASKVELGGLPLMPTVYAYWTENTYNVFFAPGIDANYDADGRPGVLVKYTESITLEPFNGTDFTRWGYKFVGWNTKADGTGTGFADGATITGVDVVNLVGTDINESSLILYAQWEKLPAVNVTFDNLIDFSAWKKTAGNGSVTTVTDTGFTITCNEGAGEATSTSHFFPVEAGKKYKIDMDITGDKWDVYIFFHNETSTGTGLEFNDTGNRYSSNGGNRSQIFTAPAGSTRAAIRVDSNGAGNSVSFDNIRVYEYNGTDVYVDYANKPVDIDSSYGELPVAYKQGYNFVGWFDANDNYIDEKSIMTSDSTVYLKSKWVLSTYVADFDAPVTIKPFEELPADLATVTEGSEGEYGKLTYTADTITYTADEILETGDYLTYNVSIKGKEAQPFELYIVPASNVLYGEDKFSVSNATGIKWETNGTKTNVTQSQSGTDDVYGFDAAFKNDNSDYSDGTYFKAILDESNKRSQIMSFTFTGTGFQLYGDCGADTGVILVTIKNNDTGKMVKSFVVDTYYNDTYGTLHQAPIVTENGLDNASYTVNVAATYVTFAGALSAPVATFGLRGGFNAPSLTPAEMFYEHLVEIGMDNIYEADDLEFILFDEESMFNSAFGAVTYTMADETEAVTETETRTVSGLVNVIDGFRVFTSPDYNDNYIISEKGSIYYNIADNLVNGTDDYISGDSLFSYVVGDANYNIVTADYDAKGAKDEVYLTNATTAITFDVKNINADSRVMVSLRAAYGTPKVKIGEDSDTVPCKTEMYYDITDYISFDEATGTATVTIQNITADTLLAVGFVKVTGNAMPAQTFSLMTTRMMMMAPPQDVEFNAPEEEPEIIVPDEPETEEPSTEIPEVPSDDADEEEKSFIDKIYDLIDFIVYLIKKLFSTLDFMKTL